MESRFKRRLSQQIQSLVDEIEDFARTEILVGLDPDPVSESAPNPNRLGLSVSETDAKILYQSEKDFTPHGVLHELLHIHRYWVDRIPQLRPFGLGADKNIGITGRIDNALEHLVIVPREADFGFEPYSYWNVTTRKNWERYPWPEMTNQGTRRRNCLMGWLTVYFLVNDDEIKGVVEDSIKTEGLFQDARNFAKKIAQVLSSKPRVISAAARFIGIPENEAILTFYDIRNRKCIHKPIPKH